MSARLGNIGAAAALADPVPIANGGTGATSASAAFTALKQAASDTVTGVVELATDAEAVTGTDTARATTCANLTARLAAPGAIGGTTPAPGTFTTLTASTSAAIGTGGTVRGISIGRASADQSLTTQTTLQNATNLSFAIAASEEWICEFTLDVGAAIATTGIKIAVNAPAAATINVSAALAADVVTAADVNVRRTTTIAGALDFTAATQVGTGIAQIKVALWVLNSTNAGTMQLQFAQSTSSGTALTIVKGSYFIAHRIA